MLKGKKILIGVTGSIAAYKVPLLVRLLVKEGAEVKLILTEAAKDFVTPLTLSTLSGNPVLSDFFDRNDGSWNSHVDLGYWADVFVIAPVSANTMGKMVNGIADNLLLATYLAASGSVLVSYIRARASSLGYDTKVGILTRMERYLVLAPTLVLNIPLVGSWIIAILANITALQRIWDIRVQTRGK